jgi:cold shock CspA family protein
MSNDDDGMGFLKQKRAEAQALVEMQAVAQMQAVRRSDVTTM